MSLLQEILESKEEKLVTYLCCANCQFVNPKAEKATKEELNEQGGIITTDKNELKRAKSVRLITLPTKIPVSEKHWCDNPKIDQYVTEHMWCQAWNALGTLRAFEEDK